MGGGGKQNVAKKDRIYLVSGMFLPSYVLGGSLVSEETSSFNL
jgi:hypothetical protein